MLLIELHLPYHNNQYLDSYVEQNQQPPVDLIDEAEIQIRYRMLREQPYAYFGTIGNVSPQTHEISENEAMATNISSKKAIKPKKPLQLDPQKTFTDDEFRTVPSDLEGLDPTQRVVWCNLRSIITPRGSLFASKYFSNFANMPQNPSFLNEVGLLPPFYYQSLFLTPDFTPNSMYKVIVNVQGQFRVVVVDDAIPVFESTMQPIWGLDREVPWELIVLKVWAKVVGGYKSVLTAKPFQFLRTFTYPSWRMKNLDKYDLDNAWRFLSTKLQSDNSQPFIQNAQSNRQINMQQLSHTKPAYEPKPGDTQFTLVAKTKNSEKVSQCGLVPNAAAYQIVKMFEVNGKKAIKISSSIRNRWNGEFSVLDQTVNQFYDPNFHDLTLSKSFIMPFDDFKKLFGLVLLTPINYKQYLSTKHTGYTVDVPINHRKAQYYRLILKEGGQLSLSVIQGLENLVQNLPKPLTSAQTTLPTMNNNLNTNINISNNVMNHNMNGVQMPVNNPPQLISNKVTSPSSASQGPWQTLSVNGINQPPVKPLPSSIAPSGLQAGQITTQYIPAPMQSLIDPWMNRSPWATTPSTVPTGQQGMSLMPQTSPKLPMMVPPMSVQTNSRVTSPAVPPLSMMQPGPSQVASMVIPQSVDPWQNINPWSNPLTSQPSIRNSNVIMPPVSSIGPSNFTASSGPRPGFETAENYGQVGNTSLMSNAYSPRAPPIVDPWRNMNPWGNQPGIQSMGPLMNPLSLRALPTSPMMAQQMETTTNIISQAPVAQLMQGQRPISPNASLLVPQLTPGLPTIQPQISASNYSAGGQSLIGPARPITPVILDPWMNRSLQGANYQVNIHPPPLGLSNVNNTGYISSPNITTPAMMGSGQPFINNGYVNSLSPTTGYVGQPSGQIAMNVPTQNAWLNINPWSGPSTVPPQQGMRGGGGPFGEPIDPWRNTSPWSEPPVIGQPIPQRTGSYFEQLSGGVSIGGSSNPMMPPPSPSSSQLLIDQMGRPLSPGIVQNQPSTIMSPHTAQINPNPNPLQSMATSNYTLVQQQSSASIDPWMNRNPWTSPPTVGSQMSPIQMQPIQSMPMQPIFMQSMPPIQSTQRSFQSGSNVIIPPQFSQQQINNQVRGSQLNSSITPNPPLITSNSPFRLNNMQPPSMQSTVPQAMMLLPGQHLSTIPFPNQGRPVLSGSGIDPWQNTNPWSNPPAIPVNTSNSQTVPVTNLQVMKPLGFQNNQINSNQQMKNAVGNLAITSTAVGSSMTRSRSQDQFENINSVNPSVAQPLKPVDMRRQQSYTNVSLDKPMTGASIASLQGPPTTQTSLIGYQAYVPHTSQLRFLKMKLVLARLIPGKYNLASKTQSSNNSQDFLNEPQDGYEYVDIDQTHGYTAGEAYFLKLPPGEYILHVKPETCAKPSSYTINFISQMPLVVSPIALNKLDKSLLLRSCFLDYSRERGNITYLDQAQTQWISYGQTFSELGYGYVGFCVDRNAPERLYCEFNPMSLKQEGYVCKDIYKNRQGEVGLFSQNGLGRCLILKQIRPDAVWPPSSLMIYKAN